MEDRMDQRTNKLLRMPPMGLAALALMTGALAAPPSYEVHLLPVPRTGTYATTATSINSSGVVGVNYANLKNYIDAGGMQRHPPPARESEVPTQRRLRPE
jgi:hypothetical protein